MKNKGALAMTLDNLQIARIRQFEPGFVAEGAFETDEDVFGTERALREWRPLPEWEAGGVGGSISFSKPCDVCGQ